MNLTNRKSSNGKYNSVAGVYHPLNPKKYIGERDPKFKSLLEYRLMYYLDKSPAVISWSYEKLTIKYKDMSSNGKLRTYYIDFVAVINTGNKVKRVWIEVKSKRETEPPRQSKNKKKRNQILENNTWIKNQCKWKTAEHAAKAKGYEFIIITEDQLKSD
jgi:hypothetical protein